MKIAMVTDVFENSLNGAVISTQRFVELLRRDHDVLVVTSGAPGPGRVVFPHFYPFGARVTKEMQFPFAWPKRKVLEHTLADVDVVHCQFPFFLGVAAAKAARRLGRPVVGSFHVQAEQVCYNAGVRSERVVGWVYSLFLRTFYNRCDAVICPSAFAEKELRRRGLTAPSRVISNGVLPLFRPLPVAPDPRFAGKFVILSVGRLAVEKRHDVLLEAVRRSRHCDRIQLVLLGTGPQREALRRLGATLPNPPILDTVPQAEIVSYYNQADLYVHASEVEVECLTVLEAMACGRTPVVADSERSATPQFALDGRSLFRKGDAEDLARKIDDWIDFPAELAASNARYFEAAAQYNIERSGERLVGLYRELVDGVSRRPGAGRSPS